MATQYRDPVITRIIAILEAEGPTELRGHYYYGDPIVTPKSALPAVYVSRDNTSIDNEDTAMDRSRMRMVVNVVHDMSREFGQSFDVTRSTGALYDYLEGRGDDYALKPSSLAYVLRKHQSLDPHLYINLDVPIELDYGISVDKRGQGMFATEATLRFEMYAIQLQPGNE